MKAEDRVDELASWAPGRTHYEGCEKTHLVCGVLKEAREAVALLREAELTLWPQENNDLKGRVRKFLDGEEG